jgi:hypothetical protein
MSRGSSSRTRPSGSATATSSTVWSASARSSTAHLVEPAFARFDRRFPDFDNEWMWPRSDVVFTALNERRLVDLAYEDLPWAHADNRMWKQPGHGPQRETMLGLALAAKLPSNDA